MKRLSDFFEKTGSYRKNDTNSTESSPERT